MHESVHSDDRLLNRDFEFPNYNDAFLQGNSYPALNSLHGSTASHGPIESQTFTILNVHFKLLRLPSCFLIKFLGA